MLHVGRFLAGRSDGPGVVVTSRGERFEGHFLEGVMWGPGVYHYSPPQPEQQEGRRQGRHRDVYHGMMNGRPQGRGCLLWSDGSREAGQVSTA